MQRGLSLSYQKGSNLNRPEERWRSEMADRVATAEARAVALKKRLRNREIFVPAGRNPKLMIDGSARGEIVAAMAAIICDRSSRSLSTSEKHFEGYFTAKQIDACSCLAVDAALKSRIRRGIK